MISPDTTITIIMAIWKRPELTAAILDYYASLKIRRRKSERLRGVHLDLIAAVSPEDPSRDLYTQERFPKWTFAEAPNEPLGAKWNAALKRAEETASDAVMIVGSDDLVSESYIRLVADALDNQAYIQPDDMYLYDLETKRCVFAKPFPGGAGRVIRKDVLDACRWKLWGDTNIFLDAAMSRRLERVVKSQFRPSHDRHEMCIVDLKSSENIWRLHPTENRMISDGKTINVQVAKEVDGKALLSQYFPMVKL